MASCATCLKALRTSSSFFVPPLHKLASANTLQATGPEDKPLLGSKLSADSGAKTRLEFGESRTPPANWIHWDWHHRDKSQGRWGRASEEDLMDLLIERNQLGE